MLTFNNAVNSNYHGLTTTQKKAIQYAEFLASTCSVDISSQDAQKFLNEVAIDDRKAINAYFLKNYENESIDAEVNAALAEINTDEMKKIEEEKERQRVESISICNAEISDYLKMIRDERNTLDGYFKRHQELKRRLDILEGRKENRLRAELEKIIKDRFWKFHNKDADCISFTTRADIVLREPAAGYSVNMGKYLVKLRANDLRVTLHEHEKNVCLVNGDESALIHPYGYDGDPMCYGTGGDAFYNFRETGDIFKMFELTKNTLSYYNPESTPYLRLTEFKSAVENGANRGEAFNISENTFICDDCGEARDGEEEYHANGICIYCYERDHFTCPSCGEDYEDHFISQDGENCQFCYDNEHFTCEQCNEVYSNDDHHNAGICVTCHRENKENEAQNESDI